MLSVKLNGGLGNQLFQLAFLYYSKYITDSSLFIESLASPRTVHSNEQYYQTIFKNLVPFFSSIKSKSTVTGIQN